VLLATLYGPQRRQDTILAGYLPLLLDRLDGRGWYYMRYRDPAHHLRLRIALAHPDEFGTVAAIVADWADELRDLRLLRDLRFPTSVPETGRWGDGPAFDLAENVLRADSRAQLVQLQQSPRPGRRALIAAGSMAIACQFTGSVEAGIRWLIDHIPAAPPAKVNRTEHTEAVLLSNPDDDWAALRTAPAGTAIAAAWADRDQALTAYRAMFPSPHTDGVQFDDVLGSLLHAMFVRAAGVDFGEEAICLHLTRAAALAWRHQPKRATR
jgi:thiopeptide-type bacteriocin biosynthesis protein